MPRTQDPYTPADRALRARLAAHTRWAKTPDRSAATAKSRAAFMERFERQVDPDGALEPDVRAKLAANARSAHFAKLALSSARARRAGR
jgi:hypothetical protein